MSIPNLTSSIHAHQNPFSPSTNSSFHKTNFSWLLRKFNHLTNLGLRSKEVLATLLPYFFHHSPCFGPIRPSKSLLFLLAESYSNRGDHVGALGYLVGSIRTSSKMTCSGLFEADLRKKPSER